MTPQGLLSLLLWALLIFYLFHRLPAYRVLIISFVVGFLYLPQTIIPLPLLIPGSRMAITIYIVVLGLFLAGRELGRLQHLRPHWVDIPILIWCTCPMASSLTNGLGPWDGFKETMAVTVGWGGPYLLGRIFLCDFNRLRVLCGAILVGGLSYAPLCILESRISPQFHNRLYGFDGTGGRWLQSIRGNGYRPVIFQEHGLVTALWMMTVAVIAIWLWQSGSLKKIFFIPMQWVVAIQYLTIILSRSFGALSLAFVGVAILFTSKWGKSKTLLLAIILIIYVYLYNSAMGNIPKETLISIAATTSGSQERAASYEFRLINEEVLGEKARQRIWFGWGGLGRNHVHDPWDGRALTVTDSLWIIAFGSRGLVGLFSLTTVMVLPSILLITMCPIQIWHHRKYAPMVVLSIVLCLQMVDCLSNAFAIPIYTMADGAILGLFIDPEDKRVPGVSISTADQHLLTSSATGYSSSNQASQES